jgi:acyl carrier protein
MNKIETAVDRQLKLVVNSSKQKLIQDTALLKEDLSLDSLKLVGLFTNMIDELKIDITRFEDEELFAIKSVGDLKRILASKTN